MSTFGTHTATSTKPRTGGTQHLFKFANGYGASVVRGTGSYGNERGLWELAVLDADGDIDSSTPVTDNVLGWLDADEVARALDQVAALPSAEQ